MVMVSAGDLLTLYMGLELQSLALYVVAALRRDSVRSSEAGLKYFVLGSLSSGMLLYGASLVYGFSGTTNLAAIAGAVSGGELPIGLLFGMVFLLVGLAFKVSAVPFHMWTPDVYEGSPTPVTAFFATAPKVAAMAMLARLMFAGFGNVVGDWTQIIALLAVLSMFLGSIAGIGQRDIKRLMAYSSISHMGFALVGLAAGTVVGVEAMLHREFAAQRLNKVNPRKEFFRVTPEAVLDALKQHDVAVLEFNTHAPAEAYRASWPA